jgi:hypothetical protein
MTMGLLDRLFGGNRARQQDPAPQYAPPPRTPQDTPTGGQPGQGRAGGDEAAIERYRYLLRTAPPEAIEQAHAEAFATLTPEQRRTVLTELGNQVPASERATSDDPRALARMATRAEMRQPGMLERTFSPRGGGMGMGGMGMGGALAGGLFASLAGAFVGTAIANEIFDDNNNSDNSDNNDNSDGGGDQAGDQSSDQTVGDSGSYASGAYGNDGYGGDSGSGDAFGGGGDYGGDVGGDYGGGFDA